MTVSIEEAIQNAITEIVGETVKNAVTEALVPVMVKLEGIEEKVAEIFSRVNEFPTEEGMRQAAAESIDYSLSELQDMVRGIELNRGRDELRQARALGRIA